MSTQSTATKVVTAVVIWIVIGAALVVGWRLFIHKEEQELIIDTGSQSQYASDIRENDDEFSGYGVNRSEKNKEGHRKDKIRLTITDDGGDCLKRLEDMRDGKCDQAVFTVDAFLKAGIVGLKGEFPGTIFLSIDESVGADAAVTFGDVKSIEDLKKYKLRFVLVPNTPNEFLARIIIFRFNIPFEKDWMVPCKGPREVYEQFEKDMQAGIPEGPEYRRVYIMWEPHVSRARKNGGNAIFSSEKLKAGIFDVKVVSRKFLKEHRELVKSSTRSYLTSVNFYQDRMEELVIEDARAHNYTLTPEDAKNVVKGIRWKNTKENYAHMGLLDGDLNGLEHMQDIIERIAEVLISTGVFTRAEFEKVPSNLLFNNSILKELQAEGFRPGSLGSILKEDDGSTGELRGYAELPALDDASWAKLYRVDKMKVPPIPFARGVADIEIEGKEVLDLLYHQINSMPDYYLVIFGNARAEGNIEANKALAKRRADGTMQYLINRGLSKNRIKSKASEPSSKGVESQSVTFELFERPY